MAEDISAGGGGIDISRLISVISPILLGTGKTTTGGTTSSSGNTNQNQSQDQTQVTTTNKSADPGTLAALLGIAQNASNNAQNPDITAQIVNNIFKQSAEAFAPTIGSAASTGLYNTSTLGLLSNDARARATAQAASSVLNFQTSQQQIANNALSSVLSATGSSTSTTAVAGKTTTATQTDNKGATNNYSITAPSVSGGNLLQSIAGIGATIFGKKAFDAASPFLTAHLVDPIKDALGFGDVGTLSSKSDFLGAAVPDSIAEGQGKVLNAAAPTITTSTSGLDISNTPGANFTTSAEGGLSEEALASANGIAPGTEAANISIAGASSLAGSADLIPGSAESLSAPTVDIAAAAGTDTGSAITSAMTPEIGTAATAGTEQVAAGVGSSLSNASEAGVAGLEGSSAGIGTGTGDLAQGGAGLVNDLSGFIDGAGNFISDAASGIGNFIGDAFANAGDTISGGLGSLGLNEAFKGIFGPEVGNDLSLGASGASFVSGQLGGPTISSLASEGLGAASSALGLTDVASGAGLEAAGGFSTFGGLESAADIGLEIGGGAAAASGVSAGILAAGAGGAELAGFGAAGGAIGAEAASAAIAEGAGVAAAAGGIGDTLLIAAEVAAAFLGWIICTELYKQGKMNITLYRYGYKKFMEYPEWGRYGYLLWARPTVKHMRKYPDGLVTRFMNYIFNLRINNIAAKAGCKIAKWTYRGMIISFAVELISCILGIAIIPLRATLLANKDWSV